MVGCNCDEPKFELIVVHYTPFKYTLQVFEAGDNVIVTEKWKQYNRVVSVEDSPRRGLAVSEAVEIQKRLAQQVVKTGTLASPRYVAGVDISSRRGEHTARAAAVVLSFPDLRLVETKTLEGPIDFPYVPGLLSFREAPLSAAVCARLENKPDVFLIDGQGFAHPRRCGFACHLGLLLDKPTIGCAKSLLLGTFNDPGTKKGNYSQITDDGEVIGAAVRTRDAVKPVFVSIGNKIDLPGAIDIVLRCCRGFRIPEPLRLAHIHAGKTC